MNFIRNFFKTTDSITLAVTSSNGFHLRPIAKFTNSIKHIKGDLEAQYKNTIVNARNTSELLSLSLKHNDIFELTLKSTNSAQYINEIKNIFNQIMNEDKPKQIDQTNNIISQGVGIGVVYYLKTNSIQKNVNITFQEAIELSLQELNNSNDIFKAQKELLISIANDCLTVQELEIKVNQKFEKTHKSDYLDILQLVQKHMGIEVTINYPNEPFILIANDLLPSQIEKLSTTKVQGVILEKTSQTSHSAILLRSFNIPSMINTIDKNLTGLIILDTLNNKLLINPTKEEIKLSKLQIEKINQAKNDANKNKFEPAITLNGKTIEVIANITDLSSANQAKQNGTKAVGLLRTEFMFKESLPTLDEQTNHYGEIFNLFDYVTVRTLDVGGDKELPYIDLPTENNPFLGIRGIRLLQTHKEILKTQIKAILRASKDVKLKIMFPMVSKVDEFKQAKELAIEIAKKEDISLKNIEFGIMIEVPSIIYELNELNSLVDFYSIGTNDLLQYMYAIERTHPTLHIDDTSPTTFKILKEIFEKAKKPISICGELASKDEAINQLIDIGYTTFSVSPNFIASVKERIRNV